MISDAAVRELVALRDQQQLTPRDVLERARDKESALHQHFEWNDSQAAHGYRLEQARLLIVQAKVRIIPCADDGPRHIRAVVEPVAYGREAAAPWIKVAPANNNAPVAAAPTVAPTPTLPPTSPGRHSWPPLIAPIPVPMEPDGDDEDDGDADDDDDDDDEEVDGDVSRVGRILSTRPTRGVNYVGHDAAVDKKGGAELLRQALAELVVLRRRYAHLDELSPVFTALDQLAHAATEPEQSRRSSATKFARELIDREGMELQTAASRASEAYGVDRWEVLEALRSRAAG